MLRATLFTLIALYSVWMEVKLCSGIVYTQHSGYGCFAAIAVPLDIPHHNAFVSYNFATTYGLPYDAKTLISGPKGTFVTLQELNENGGRAASMEINKSNFSTKNDSDRSFKWGNQLKTLITKRAVYKMLRDKFKVFGFEPKFCLLKLICKVKASVLGSNNGVLGSILHILLTPSASEYENLPRKFYKAEEDGLKGECYKYEVKCPQRILDMVSVPIEGFLLNEKFYSN